MIPGEWLLADEPIEINAGRRSCSISVRNTGDRPIQVGSHFHFFEVNRALDFDRAATKLGMRLDVPSGQSIRFEAGRRARRRARRVRRPAASSASTACSTA